MEQLLNWAKLFGMVVARGFLEKRFLALCLWSERKVNVSKQTAQRKPSVFFHVAKRIDLFSVVSDSVP